MIETFGETASGEPVKVVTLQADQLTVRVLTWGAVLQSVRLQGVAHDLTHGSDRLSDYLGGMTYHGALIGPVVNRLTNAQAVIAGVRHQFEVNFNGRHTLHSGSVGTHRQNWSVISADQSSCTLGLTLPAGAGGFPANRQVRAHFAVTAPASLTLQVTTTSDAQTIANFANHSYWNLDGTASWAGHNIQVAAEAFLPCCADIKPTGEIRAVAGGEMDFRQPRTIAPHAPDLDNCFVLGRAATKLRDVLWLRGKSGLEMTIATTEPGVQLYDGRNAVRPGRATFEGLAIECQGWPDAPNHQGFPSITVTPDKALTQVTQWRFKRLAPRISGSHCDV
jgi:aldose 1-epimerase